MDLHHGARPAPPDDDRPIRGEVRLIGHRRVSHGLHLREREGLSPEQEFLRDLRAWLLVLADDAVFTHVTAARLLGWRLPSLPAQVPVFAAVHGHERRPRRVGLICSSLVGEPPPRTGPDRLPVDWPEEILLRCARDLGVLDLVIMIDSALELGHVDGARMEAVLASKRPGVRRLRRAWELSHRRCESAGESLLRVFHAVLDVPVDPQVDLYDEDGRHLGRADLRVVGTPYVHEYDGAVHRGKIQHRADLRRERGWGDTFERKGFTLDDLLNHPLVVMHEIDGALGRPHKRSRIALWRTLVAESLYGEAGQARVMNRWQRALGVTDWSKTAS